MTLDLNQQAVLNGIPPSNDTVRRGGNIKHGTIADLLKPAVELMDAGYASVMILYGSDGTLDDLEIRVLAEDAEPLLPMAWAKRQFFAAEYGPYMDLLSNMIMTDPTRWKQYMMVSAGEDRGGFDTYYVGVPTAHLLPLFKGFTRVADGELPTTITSVVIADANQVRKRFTVRSLRAA